MNLISIGKERTQRNTEISGTPKEEENSEDLPGEAFSEEEFKNAWEKLTRNLKEAGRDSLFVTLSLRLPQIDGEKITVIIENKTQEQSIDREKQEICDFLRNELNNHRIQLETQISEGEETAMLYTSKEKFKKLVEKNPNLLELKKRLDLDLEF